ncbi:MAG: TIGR03619 family F420-dependent LLM class oxidoreductase [Actinobacteria bacterium]|nr:TIGR03619 family F420-dependent LLM class oxidoreductase [Actinomycetota bacterium]
MCLPGVCKHGNVKVRVGYGLGVRTQLNDSGFLDVVDTLERLRFDSLWLSERIGGEAPDPLVAMSMAAARTTRLKLGMSVMVLPGRNPIVLAKELATLDRMSNGRLLPAFGLGVADPHEQQAFGVERSQRAKMFNEALAVLRSCWMDESVTFHGTHYNYDNLRVLPKPLQQPPEVWLGGIAESELKRVGRMADGWLPSFVTPEDATAGWKTVTDIAAENSREIDPEHFGVLIPYTIGDPPPQLLAGLKARRPDLDDVSVLVPSSWHKLSHTIEQFIEVGASKFVVIPFIEPGSVNEWNDHLEDAATHLMPLQN